jgi:DUF218 domain
MMPRSRNSRSSPNSSECRTALRRSKTLTRDDPVTDGPERDNCSRSFNGNGWDVGSGKPPEYENCPIILMGWNYRDDTELCISDAIACYLRSAHLIDGANIYIDRQSRDTVGDAILSKLKYQHLMAERALTVVTSDYHVGRTRRVFEFVYGSGWNICVDGVSTLASDQQRNHEQCSLEAFSRTFKGVKRGDDSAIWDALIHRHPFYNGTIYPVFGAITLGPTS